jgi:hypothetical protein
MNTGVFLGLLILAVAHSVGASDASDAIITAKLNEIAEFVKAVGDPLAIYSVVADHVQRSLGSPTSDFCTEQKHGICLMTFTGTPTGTPTFTGTPTARPTKWWDNTPYPTGSPITPSTFPTAYPTSVSGHPDHSTFPTSYPTGSLITPFPTGDPTPFPTGYPSFSAYSVYPTAYPTTLPSESPTVPSTAPTPSPSHSPTSSPTPSPSQSPTSSPTPGRRRLSDSSTFGASAYKNEHCFSGIQSYLCGTVCSSTCTEDSFMQEAGKSSANDDAIDAIEGGSKRTLRSASRRLATCVYGDSACNKIPGLIVYHNATRTCCNGGGSFTISGAVCSCPEVEPTSSPTDFPTSFPTSAATCPKTGTPACCYGNLACPEEGSAFVKGKRHCCSGGGELDLGRLVSGGSCKCNPSSATSYPTGYPTTFPTFWRYNDAAADSLTDELVTTTVSLMLSIAQ